jgi:hypothetical protein
MIVPAWVSELGITAQVLIAFMAIYGEKIRGRLSRPRLYVSLPKTEGDREPRQIDSSIITVSYHRLQVRNTTRYSVANEVQVFITKIERQEPTSDIGQNSPVQYHWLGSIKRFTQMPAILAIRQSRPSICFTSLRKPSTWHL